MDEYVNMLPSFMPFSTFLLQNSLVIVHKRLSRSLHILRSDLDQLIIFWKRRPESRLGEFGWREFWLESPKPREVDWELLANSDTKTQNSLMHCKHINWSWVISCNFTSLASPASFSVLPYDSRALRCSHANAWRDVATDAMWICNHRETSGSSLTLCTLTPVIVMIRCRPVFSVNATSQVM